MTKFNFDGVKSRKKAARKVLGIFALLCASLLILASDSAFALITLNAGPTSGAAAATGATWNMPDAAGSNRKVVVIAFASNTGNNATITGVTWNGNALAAVAGSLGAVDGTTGDPRSQVWFYDIPGTAATGGSGAIIVTASNTPNFTGGVAWIVNGVLPGTTTAATQDSDSAINPVLTLNLNPPFAASSNAWVFTAAVGIRNPAPTVTLSGGHVQDVNASTVANHRIVGARVVNLTATASNNNYNFTTASVAGSAAAWLPAPVPTASPTPSPSASPTASPTPSRTPSPTASPTASPTETPTESPTESPTETPTASPTESPTETPTESPTASPTESPTETPTESPTESPTETPTESPTESPTATETETPTPSPTPNAARRWEIYS